jgi:hypothetical protein
MKTCVFFLFLFLFLFEVPLNNSLHISKESFFWLYILTAFCFVCVLAYQNNVFLLRDSFRSVPFVAIW